MVSERIVRVAGRSSSQFGRVSSLWPLARRRCQMHASFMHARTHPTGKGKRMDSDAEWALSPEANHLIGRSSELRPTMFWLSHLSRAQSIVRAGAKSPKRAELLLRQSSTRASRSMRLIPFASGATARSKTEKKFPPAHKTETASGRNERPLAKTINTIH